MEKPLKEAFHVPSTSPGQSRNREAKQGDLAGFFGYDAKYNNINYEIAYKIFPREDYNVIMIYMAGTRENFYEALKRYIKS